MKRRQSLRHPHLWYVRALWHVTMHSRVVPAKRKVYFVPMAATFLWETKVRAAYAAMLGTLKSVLPGRVFATIQRMRGR